MLETDAFFHYATWGFCKTGFQTLGLTCGDAKLLEDPITTEYKIILEISSISTRWQKNFPQPS